jgi:hypothetical protein
MRIAFSILSFCLLTAVSRVQAQPALETAPLQNGAQPARPVTPQDAVTQRVESFILALNGQGHFYRALGFVAGAKLGYYGANEIFEEWGKARINTRLEAEKIEIFDFTPTEAKARVTYAFESQHLKSSPFTEVLLLRTTQIRAGERATAWKIVAEEAPTPEALQGLTTTSVGGAPVLTALAQSLAHPQKAVDAFHTAQSIRNLKTLGLGMTQFVYDYDESYALLPQYQKEALKLYLPKTSYDPWQVPARPEETYSFNANLCDASLGAIKNPAQTILFYEGQDEKPVFRYNGKAALGFVTGHVRLVTPEQLKNLSWTP